MIRFRRAEKQDFDAINNLLGDARVRMAALGIDQWQDGYPEPELIAADIESGIGIVAESEGALAGYMVLLSEVEPIYEHIDGAWINNGGYATVHRMAVDGSFCGSGLSSAMLAYAGDFARENGLQSVRADTHRGNVRMRRLLEKNAYLYCGEVLYDVPGDPVRVAYEKEVRRS